MQRKTETVNMIALYTTFNFKKYFSYLMLEVTKKNK